MLQVVKHPDETSLTVFNPYAVIWHYYPGCSLPGDVWFPAGNNQPGRPYWYVINIETGRSKKIGPVSWRGVNYFDRAIEEARRRNRRWRVCVYDEKEKVIARWIIEDRYEWEAVKEAAADVARIPGVDDWTMTHA